MLLLNCMIQQPIPVVWHPWRTVVQGVRVLIPTQGDSEICVGICPSICERYIQDCEALF